MRDVGACARDSDAISDDETERSRGAHKPGGGAMAGDPIAVKAIVEGLGLLGLIVVALGVWPAARAFVLRFVFWFILLGK